MTSSPTAPSLEALASVIVAALAEREEVLEAYLFGSVATDRAQAHSDIDVAVFIDKDRIAEPSFGHAAEYGTLLIAALHFNDVDVVVLNDAPPLLYHRVLRDGIRVLSRDVKATTTREGYAISRYCDDIFRLRIIDEARRGRKSADS